MDMMQNDSTALAVASRERMAAVYSEIDDGYDNIPLSLPYLNVDHKQGHLVLSLDERRFEELNVVILATRKSRCHFNPVIGNEPAWYCRCAVDSVKEPGRGILNEKELNENEQAVFRSGGAGGLCAKCPHKNWGANGEKPNCTESINLLLFIREENQFAIFKTSRTSMKPTTDYLNSFRFGIAADGKKKRHIDFVTTLKLEKQTKPGMSWYNPRYIRGEALNDADRAEMVMVYSGIAEALKATLRADPEPPKEYQMALEIPAAHTPLPEGAPSEAEWAGADEVDIFDAQTTANIENYATGVKKKGQAIS